MINASSPDGHGWTASNNELRVSLKRVLIITVKSHCERGLCSCHRSDLSCNDFCGCKNCINYSIADQEQHLQGDLCVDVDDDGVDDRLLV